MRSIIHPGRLLLFLVLCIVMGLGCNVLDELDDDQGPVNRRAKTGDARCFDTFQQVKAYMHEHGTPELKGWQWHHIVGQHKSNIAKFGAHDLHCTDNLVYVPLDTHRKINGHYAKKHPRTGNQTLRDWLKPMSFDEQFEQGLEVLDLFGVEYGR